MSKWTAVPPASLSVILPGDCTKSLQGAVLGMPQGPVRCSLGLLWLYLSPRSILINFPVSWAQCCLLEKVSDVGLHLGCFHEPRAVTIMTNPGGKGMRGHCKKRMNSAT